MGQVAASLKLKTLNDNPYIKDSLDSEYTTFIKYSFGIITIKC